MSRYARALARDNFHSSQIPVTKGRKDGRRPSNDRVKRQGKYARALERVEPLTRPTGDQAKGRSGDFRWQLPSHLFPGDGAWRREMDRLRGAILTARQLQSIQVLVICGTRSDDGATAVGADLALALTEMDKICVVADVGQLDSSARQVLQAALPAKAVKGDPANGSALQLKETDVKNLFLGAATDGASSLMSLLLPINQLQRLRDRFGFVILVAPPLNTSSGAPLLAANADGVILVAQPDKTRIEDLETSKRELERVGANLLGVVLNQCKYYLPKRVAQRL